MNPHPDPPAPHAARESVIEHVSRLWHAVVPAKGADEIADLCAADGVIETPTAMLHETRELSWASRAASRATLFSPPVAAKEPSSTGWPDATRLADGHQPTWQYPHQADGRTGPRRRVHGLSTQHLVCSG